MNEVYSSDYPDNIFDWLRVLFVAQARKEIKPEVAALGGFLALSGDGISGENCYFDEARFMAEFAVHRATLYRRLEVLQRLGWVEQTRRPTYTGKGSPHSDRTGRKAQYRVAWPRPTLRHDLPAESSRTTTRDAETRQAPKSCRTAPAPDATRPPVDNPSRVAIPAESCRTTTRDAASLPTCDLPTLNPGHPSASTTGRARDRLASDDGHPFTPDPAAPTECFHCSTLSDAHPPLRVDHFAAHRHDHRKAAGQ